MALQKERLLPHDQDQPIYPIQILKAQTGRHPRTIEHCGWFRSVQIDLDLPNGTLPDDPRIQSVFTQLIRSIRDQGHPEPGRPSVKSDMVIGVTEIPPNCGPLFEGVAEIPPMMWEASRRFLMNAFKQKYIAAVAHDKDIAALPKRVMEEAMRRLMGRLGTYNVLNIHPDYFALATMEGGLAVDSRNSPAAIYQSRDRLVTHACSKDAGSFDERPNVISEARWQSSAPIRRQLTQAFQQLGVWGYIDKPFDIRSVASEKRARLAERLEQMGWSRQSESAGAIVAPMNLAREYLIEGTSCVVISTATGRGRQIDKRNMNPNNDLVAVSIKQIYRGDPFGLSNFQRLALGRVGFDVVPPSIEFDEIAVAILNSPRVRVSPHPYGRGFIRDPKGSIILPMLRAFIHTHNNVEMIAPQIIFGENARRLVEYIPANLDDFPYHVGCGKDQTFAISIDAIRRSEAIQNPDSSYLVAFFNAFGHSDNLLVATKPFPGTDYIPEDPLSEVLLPLIHKDTGPVRLTAELVRV